MTASTMTDGPDNSRSAHYDKPGLRLRLLQMLLHTEDAHQEALLGDLLEDRAGGRSRFWFWRQVLHGALLAATRDARASTRRTIRVCISTWVFAEGYGRIASFFVYGRLIAASPFRLELAWPTPTMYAIVTVAAAGSAWYLTRHNRGHEGLALATYLSSVMLVGIGSLMWSASAGQIDAQTLALAVIFRFVVVPAAIVAGGTLGRRVEVIRTA